VYGQTSITDPASLMDESANSSFNAEGTINTILFLQDASSNNTQPIVKDINTNLSSKYLLGGKWRVDVLNNNVTYFKSNFTMIEADGRISIFIQLFISQSQISQLIKVHKID
jgi:hypothetical protein